MKIAGKSVRKVHNNKPRQYKDVQVWASQAYPTDSPPANAKIRNLKLNDGRLQAKCYIINHILC